MKTWRRASYPCVCGGCGAVLMVGDPILVLFIRSPNSMGAIEKIRCQACAGEAPPDLPPLVEASRRTKRMEPVSRVAARAVPLDWKARAAGREPGDET